MRSFGVSSSGIWPAFVRRPPRCSATSTTPRRILATRTGLPWGARFCGSAETVPDVHSWLAPRGSVHDDHVAAVEPLEVVLAVRDAAAASLPGRVGVE